jgi:hypothetical protein
MEATEVAHVLSILVRDERAVPQQAAVELHRLLSTSLAAPDAVARRWDSLALLASLLTERGGVIPTTAEYDDARRERRSNAPVASTLIAAHGRWLRAVRSAAAHMSSGRAQALAARPPSRGYTRGESAAALARFRQRFGIWPTEAEYEEWAALSRHCARHTGAPDPRLPSSGPIRTAYGTFDRALQAAQTVYGHG